MAWSHCPWQETETKIESVWCCFVTVILSTGFLQRAQKMVLMGRVGAVGGGGDYGTST